MAPKRPGESPSSTPVKALKTEPGTNDDFSSSVKRKLSSSTRTGQACDRCKVRKIRCDARPGGCTACAANSTECKTTDRITGRATSRGYTESLEQENNALKAIIAELQKQKQDPSAKTGASSAQNDYSDGSEPVQGMSWPGKANYQPWDNGRSTLINEGHHHRNSVIESLSDKGQDAKSPRAPYYGQTECTGNNHLGLSSCGGALSPMKGTSLSLFGFQIDLADFIPTEVDELSSFDSFQSFVAFAFRRDPKPDKVDLPATYEECETLVGWYFRSLNAFTPIVHKPDFMAMLSRIYHDPKFRPVASDMVLVHMVLAIIKFQFSTRNGDPKVLEQSMSHYKYALSFLHELVDSHKLADVQALGLICTHLRSFQKPGAAWVVTSTALSFAVELGLHRCLQIAEDATSEKTACEAEMRKRIFWTILSIHVGLCGKLGRPIPIRMEDIDIGFPEPLEDNLASETTTLGDFRKCSFRIGIVVQRLSAVFLHLYSTIYAVHGPNSSRAYESKVKELERELAQWRSYTPAELRESSETSEEDRISAYYLQLWDLEFQLALHHPALCRSTNVAFIDYNLNVCLEATSKILKIVAELWKYKCLDYTWLNCTTYLAAIFTTLYIYSQRKDQITSSDLLRLRGDMDLWLKVFGDMGITLKSGHRLQNRVKAIVEQAMGVIGRNMPKRTASMTSNTTNNSPIRHMELNVNKRMDNSDQSSQLMNGDKGDSSSRSNKYLKPEEMDPQSSQYIYSSSSATPCLAYPDSSNTLAPPIAFNPPYETSRTASDPSASTSQNPVRSSSSFHLQGQKQSHPPQKGSAYSPYPTSAFGNPTNIATYPNILSPDHHDNIQQRQRQHQHQQQQVIDGPSSWHQWAQMTMANSGPQDYSNLANALMALGGREGSSMGSNKNNVASAVTTSTPAAVSSTNTNANESTQTSSHPLPEIATLAAQPPPSSSSLSASNQSSPQIGIGSILAPPMAPPLLKSSSTSSSTLPASASPSTAATPRMNSVQGITGMSEQASSIQSLAQGRHIPDTRTAGYGYAQPSAQASHQPQMQTQAQAQMQTHAHMQAEQVWPLMVFDIRQDGSG